jgi:hypothetical protein
MLQFKLLAIAVALLAIGGLVWKEHRSTRRAQAAEAKVETLQASLAAAEANRKIEQDDRRRADESAKSLEAELARIRAQPVLTGVRCTAPRMPRASNQSTATAGSNAGTAQPELGLSGEDLVGRDVSVGLTEYGKRCEAVAATLVELQAWELARTH